MYSGQAGGPVTENWELAADVLVGPITSRAGNVFSTPDAYVEPFRMQEDFAAVVRDHLGVPHLDDLALLEIRLNAAVVANSGIVKKPTFADALGYPPFMASSPDDTEHGWARLLRAHKKPLREPWASLKQSLG